MADPTGYVLAFDFGLRFIGVACGQTITGTASPLTTLKARDGQPDWSVLQSIVAEWRPVLLLVGLPLNMDDTESGMSERARAFATSLERRTNTPVALVDERLTSRSAKSLDP
ncbi:MAG: Holliday junction resolvase RuvX, partial [Pseudomonadales bacterium]|nr:Holliday junction resolvase RuvX [Pseudomonadales bacterium]